MKDIRILNNRGSLKKGQEINGVDYESAMQLVRDGDAELIEESSTESKTRKPRKKKDE